MSENVAPETLDRGRYRIERELGVGGTATVYLATDTRIGVHRAIKLLSPEFARSRQNRARFMNEAHAQAGLKHNNVLMVHDVIDDDQGLYMVMELAESDSLGARVGRTGPLSPKEVAEVGITVGGALSVAHAAGVIHRDIKPANILVDRHGVLKLADFGIARVIDREGELTRTGTVMGTWAYMPPEQRENTHVADARSDIYALGVTLHALLTGRHSPNLHNQEAYAEVFADVDPGLARIIQKATRLYPEDRYPRMDAMVADLRAIVAALEGPSLFDGDVTDPQGIVALTGAPAQPRRPQPAPAPAPPRAPVVAPTGSTAVPVAPTVDTWLPEEGKTTPPQEPKPGGRPMGLLIGVAALAFLVVAAGGAVWVPRLLDEPVEAPQRSARSCPQRRSAAAPGSSAAPARRWARCPCSRAARGAARSPFGQPGPTAQPARLPCACPLLLRPPLPAGSSP